MLQGDNCYITDDIWIYENPYLNAATRILS